MAPYYPGVWITASSSVKLFPQMLPKEIGNTILHYQRRKNSTEQLVAVKLLYVCRTRYSDQESWHQIIYCTNAAKDPLPVDMWVMRLGIGVLFSMFNFFTLLLPFVNHLYHNPWRIRINPKICLNLCIVNVKNESFKFSNNQS